MIAAKKCFSILAVLGVSSVDPNADEFDEEESRNGIPADRARSWYLIRGGYGNHEADAALPGTRWVELSDLIENCTVGDQQKLEAFDKSVPARMAQARKGIWQSLAEAKEAEAGGEDEDSSVDSSDDDGHGQHQEVQGQQQGEVPVT